MNFSEFLNQNLLSILLLLVILVIMLASLCIYTLGELKKLRQRYEIFTGGKKKPEYNMEAQFTLFHKESERLEEKYDKLSDIVKDIDQNMENCIQKIGMVRYNPFEEVGSNLSYAITLLDNNDNGVVLNGIHTRNGSFSYAKPIENGTSTYKLSGEELQSIDAAKNSGYAPLNRIEMLEEVEKRLPRASGKIARHYTPSENLTLDEIIEKMSMDMELEPKIGGNDFEL